MSAGSGKWDTTCTSNAQTFLPLDGRTTVKGRPGRWWGKPGNAVGDVDGHGLKRMADRVMGQYLFHIGAMDAAYPEPVYMPALSGVLRLRDWQYVTSH